MADIEKVIKGLECCQMVYECKPYEKCPYSNGLECGDCNINRLHYDALALLKEQKARIQKYEYVFDFLGIGFRQWATKILDGEAEVICETDEHEYKTVITFKLI